MVLSEILPELRRHLKYNSILHCLPFRWDDKTGQIVEHSKKSQLSVRIGTALQLLYISFQICSLFPKRIGAVTVLPGDKFVAGMITTIYTGSLVVSFRMDFTPMQVWNRLISGQGKQLKIKNR